jgi:acetyltransferase-like isoleucine patch superfamily enzyme
VAYITRKELISMGFKSIGSNVSISAKASIYDCANITIGDNSRIDDYCVVSGKIKIGKNVHITPMCLIAGGEKGISLQDYTTIAYGVKIFTQSDDYSGSFLTNSTIPDKYKRELKESIVIKKHSIIGAGSIIMPGVTLEIGTSVGANSMVNKSTDSWGIYYGSPAIRIKSRSKRLLLLEEQMLNENQDEYNC